MRFGAPASTCLRAMVQASRALARSAAIADSESRSEACVHLYVQGRGEFDLGGRRVVIEQKTGYPWREKVAITVRSIETA